MKNRRITTRFAPDTRFELNPLATAPFRAGLETEFERLQNRLLKDLLNRTDDPELALLYRHAANEAVALAASTGYPLLTLPLLFEEKTGAARTYADRQAQILRQTREMAGEAA